MIRKIIIALHLITVFAFANEKVSLQLQWKFQFQFAGYIMAKEKGFYDNIGLDVSFKEWDYGIDMTKNILEQNSTFSIVRSTAFVDNSNKNDFIFIAAMFQSSPMVLLANKSSGIKTFQDIKNKKVMATDDIKTEASLIAMLFSQKLSFKDMDIIEQSFDVNDLKNGNADLTAGYITNEPFVLRELGGDPVIFNPKDYGFDFYSDILVANRKLLNNNPQLVKNFTQASLKGWEYAFDNIEETAKIIYDKYNTLNKSKEALIYEGEELKKIAYYNTDTLGSIKKEKLEKIYDIYKLLGLTNTTLLFEESIYQLDQVTKQLTQKEKDYISEKRTIKVCTNPNWSPVEFTNRDGEPNGISIDILKLIGEKSGLEFEFIKTTSWGESQEYLKKKKCDILPAAIKTKQREKYANFTSVHSSYKLAIITKNDKPLVDDLEQIIDKKLSRKKDSGLIEKLQNIYPDLKILETKGYKEAFQAVEYGDAYFTISTLPVLSYYKNKYNFDNLQIAGYSGLQYDLSIAVRDDDIALLNILDKILLTVSKESKKIINEKWNQKNYDAPFDYTILRNISIALSILFLFFLYKQYILKKSLKEFHEIFNATMEGVSIFKDGICIDLNQSCVDILGYKSKDEILGKHILSFVPKEYQLAAQEKLKEEDTLPYELHILKKDNSTIPVLLKGHYIKKRGVRVVSIVDITLLKQQEQQLLQQAKLVSMGEMIGNIAHQWRQPLSIISTSATGIKVQKEYGVLDDQFLNKACDAINNNAQYLSKTIDDFKNFIKGERVKSKFKATDFMESLLNLIEPSIKNNNITIVQDIDEEVFINSYKNELLQCFMNIYNNSKDAFSNISEKQEKLILFSIKKANNSILLSIKDTAGGIPKEVISKIFDPYFTTKHKSQGTGLGLHMTYNIIVNGMDGEIIAKSSEFKYKDKNYTGAEFIITLPL